MLYPLGLTGTLYPLGLHPGLVAMLIKFCLNRLAIAPSPALALALMPSPALALALMPSPALDLVLEQCDHAVDTY
jgi:hypothetical protein